MILAAIAFCAGLYIAWYQVPAPPTWITKIKNNITDLFK